MIKDEVLQKMGDESEVVISQVRKIQNTEAVFEEFLVQMTFAADGLWGPKILQNEAEETPLGTVGNYRSKYVVRYFAFLMADTSVISVRRMQ